MRPYDVLLMLNFIFKSSLIVEVLDTETGGQKPDKVDHFIFPLCSPLNKFNSCNPLICQGLYGIGILTLSYGNLTTDTTSCSSMANSTSTTFSFPSQGIQYTTRTGMIYQGKTFSIGCFKLANTTLILIYTGYTTNLCHSVRAAAITSQQVPMVTSSPCPVSMVTMRPCPALNVGINLS